MLEMESVQNLPVELCEIHPMAAMRFSYEKDIEGLVESIKRHGQLEPGRAVPGRDGKFLVYIGGRRLHACKRLFSEKVKLDTYKAYVDEGLTEEQIIPRAIAENATDKNQRSDIELVEELHFLSSLPFSMEVVRDLALSGGMGKEALGRKMGLMKFLGPDEFESLYKIEEETGFRFELGHISGIWKFSEEDKRVFFGACACAAANKWTVEGLNEDLVLGSAAAAVSFPWFPKLFPNITPSSEKENTKIESTRRTPLARGSRSGRRRVGKGDRDDPLNSLLKNAINSGKYYYFISCDKCGAEIPFDFDLRSKGSPVATTYEFKPDGMSDGERTALDSRFEGTIECKKCEVKWKLVLIPSGEKIRAFLEEASEEEEPSVGEIIEPAVTSYSPPFNRFVIVDQGKWYFFDSSIGRRIPMKEDEIQKHKSTLKKAD